MGIHAANVAPEFGVTETKSLVKILNNLNFKNLADKFLEISYNSKKWKKWIINEKKINDYEKSIISGHYVLSSPEVQEIIKVASKNNEKNINNEIKKDIKKSIKRYLYYLN